MRLVAIALAVATGLSGCAVSTGPVPQQPQRQTLPAPQVQAQGVTVGTFRNVAARVEPVAESICREAGNVRDCDFRILVDTRPGVPPNAYQTLDNNGRPILVMTKALLDEMDNTDEAAFVLSHEAAHHIRGHLASTQQSATLGAILAGTLAAAGGVGDAGIQTAQQLGATVGSRTYSKQYELEADSLGTVIAARSGYNPVNGAEFFSRIDDPGNVFLGTHPPNADRQAVVRRTAAGL